MFDAIDLLNPRAGYPYCGNYRERKDAPPVTFYYAELDPRSKTYQSIIANLMTTAEALIIRTKCSVRFAPKQYISTQDGRLWIIESTQKRNTNGEISRIFSIDPNAEQILALINRDNPERIK